MERQHATTGGVSAADHARRWKAVVGAILTDEVTPRLTAAAVAGIGRVIPTATCAVAQRCSSAPTAIHIWP